MTDTPELAAWSFDLMTATGWRKELSFRKPNVPPAVIRNLTPLYSRDWTRPDAFHDPSLDRETVRASVVREVIEGIRGLPEIDPLLLTALLEERFFPHGCGGICA